MVRQLTAAYEKHGEWYVAYIKEIPGVNTQGQTLDEARENLEDAFQMFLDANRELAHEETAHIEGLTEEPFASIERAA